MEEGRRQNLRKERGRGSGQKSPEIASEGYSWWNNRPEPLAETVPVSVPELSLSSGYCGLWR